MTAETDIAAIDNGGANTAAEVRTALTSVLNRADRLFGIPPGGTYDDEFDDATIDGAWSQVDVGGGAATWTEGYGAISVLNPASDIAAETHSLVKAMTINTGDYIEASCRVLSINQNYPSIGIVFADGNTYTAGQQAITIFDTSQQGFSINDYSGYNTRDAQKASATIEQSHPAWLLRMRMTYVSANTFRSEMSLDGLTWLQPFADQAITLTPTYGGLVIQGWTNSAAFAGTFNYFRSNA